MSKYINARLKNSRKVAGEFKPTLLEVESATPVDLQKLAILVPYEADFDREDKYTYSKFLVEGSITNVLRAYQPIQPLLSEPMRSLTDFLVSSLVAMTSGREWGLGVYTEGAIVEDMAYAERYLREGVVSLSFDHPNRLSFLYAPVTSVEEGFQVQPPQVECPYIPFAMLTPVNELGSPFFDFQCAVRLLSETVISLKADYASWEEEKSGLTKDCIQRQRLYDLRSFAKMAVYWVNSYSFRGEYFDMDRFEILRKLPYSLDGI